LTSLGTRSHSRHSIFPEKKEFGVEN